MAVTSNCVNEKKFFQLEPGEETRTFPILIDTYQCTSVLYANRPATRASPHFGRGLAVTDPLKMFYMGILDSILHLLV